MKRSKFILLALVAALVLMGAGYAAWTQTFTIQSTIETGELLIQVKNEDNTVEVYRKNGDRGEYVNVKTLENYDKYLDELAVVPEKVNGGSEKETLSSISFTLKKVHPGTKIVNKLSFKNIGTVKAETLLDEENWSFTPADFNSPLWEDLVIKVNDKVIEGSGMAKFNDLRNTLAEEIGVLDVGEPNAKQIIIEQLLPENSDNNTENRNLEWKIGLVFKQAFN